MDSAVFLCSHALPGRRRNGPLDRSRCSSNGVSQRDSAGAGATARIWASIVFSGNMEYHPNIDAVRYFRTEIWPLLRQRHPELVWRLVGRNPSAVSAFTGAPGIEVVGPVADAVPELARSRIAIVPLRAGSGTRLKILEAWAAGLPVVSTSIGAEGLPARHGEHLLLADSAVDFAQAVTRLLTCEELCSHLGKAGRLLLEKEFTWKSAWESLNF